MINPKIWAFDLDIKKKVYITNITPKQGDIESNIFRINLHQDLEAYDLTGLSVKAYFKRPDGAISFINGVVTEAVEGKVDITLTNQILNIEGIAYCELLIVGTAGEALATITFRFEILPSMNYTEVESTSEFNALVTALSDITQVKNDIDAAESAISALQTNKADKTYVDQQDLLKVAKSGDAMTGALTFNNNVGIQGKNTGGAIRAILKLNNFNNVEVGNSAQKTYLHKAAGLVTWDGVTERTILDTLHSAESSGKHITESGNNANGKYIKFDDGTMICYAKFSGTPGSTVSIQQIVWTFPIEFIDSNVSVSGSFFCIQTGVAFRNGILLSNTSPSTKNSCNFTGVDFNQAQFNSWTCDLIAFGRYK